MKEKNEFGKIARDMVGTKMTYRAKKRGKIIETEAIVLGIRHSSGFIFDMKTLKEYPAIDLLLEPTDGSKPFWSRPFHNK